MGIITNNKEEKRLYKAYGMIVYGVENKYDWTIYQDKPTEIIYTTLRIEKNGKNIFDIYLGNRFIFKNNFDRTIDNFLYWIDKDKPDDFGIEKAVFKSLTQTDSLFNHLINNRKYEEKRKQELKRRMQESIEEENRKLLIVYEYCKKKNLIYKVYYEKLFLIKILNEKTKELIESTDMEKKEWLLTFMQEHPENKDAVIVMDGTIDEIIEKIS